MFIVGIQYILVQLSPFSTPEQKYQYVLNTILGNINIPKLPELKPKHKQQCLGRFYKMDLPFSGRVVDPRLLDDQITIVGMNMIKSLKADVLHYILLGKSGEEKTRAIFDVARNLFTIAFECVTRADQRQDTTKDRTFLEMAGELSFIAYSNIGEEEKRQLIENRVDLEIVTRLLFLRILTLRFPALTPQQFLLSQLNGGSEVVINIAKKLIQETPNNIKDLRFYCLQDLELNVLKGYQQNLVFAIDEAILAQEFLYGLFRSPKSNHKRGMLTALVESLMEMKVSTIYTNRT